MSVTTRGLLLGISLLAAAALLAGAKESVAPNPASLEALGVSIDEQAHQAKERGDHFTSIATDARLRRIEQGRPFIAWQRWRSENRPGFPIKCRVGIHNPGSESVDSIYVTTSVGLSHLASGNETALLAVDNRYFGTTGPKFPGLTIEAGKTVEIDAVVLAPVYSVEGTTLGNVVLFKAAYHGASEVLDRSFFPFELSSYAPFDESN